MGKFTFDPKMEKRVENVSKSPKSQFHPSHVSANAEPIVLLGRQLMLAHGKLVLIDGGWIRADGCMALADGWLIPADVCAMPTDG